MMANKEEGKYRKEKCGHCNGNHKVEKCWEIIGYPSWHYKSKDKPQMQRGFDPKKQEMRRPDQNMSHCQKSSYNYKANAAGKGTQDTQHMAASQNHGGIMNGPHLTSEHQ